MKQCVLEGHVISKFLEPIVLVILCFEKRYPKENTVARLKSNILAPQIFGLATPMSHCIGYHCITCQRCL